MPLSAADDAKRSVELPLPVRAEELFAGLAVAKDEANLYLRGTGPETRPPTNSTTALAVRFPFSSDFQLGNVPYGGHDRALGFSCSTYFARTIKADGFRARVIFLPALVFAPK